MINIDKILYTYRIHNIDQFNYYIILIILIIFIFVLYMSNVKKYYKKLL